MALWGASRGASALATALGTIYTKPETRSWFRRQLIAIAVTIAIAVLVIVALSLLVVGPTLGHWATDRFGLGDTFDTVWSIGRWVGAGLLVMFVWALAYKLLPNTDAPLHVFTPGAIVGVLVWLGLSALFGLYLQHFNSFETTYGTLGGAIIFLLWLWLSNIVLLVGAEINDVLADLRAPKSVAAAQLADPNEIDGLAARQRPKRRSSPTTRTTTLRCDIAACTMRTVCGPSTRTSLRTRSSLNAHVNFVVMKLASLPVGFRGEPDVPTSRPTRAKAPVSARSARPSSSIRRTRSCRSRTTWSSASTGTDSTGRTVHDRQGRDSAGRVRVATPSKAIRTNVLNQLDGFGTFEAAMQVTFTEEVDATHARRSHRDVPAHARARRAIDPATAHADSGDADHGDDAALHRRTRARSPAVDQRGDDRPEHRRSIKRARTRVAVLAGVKTATGAGLLAVGDVGARASDDRSGHGRRCRATSSPSRRRWFPAGTRTATACPIRPSSSGSISCGRRTRRR